MTLRRHRVLLYLCGHTLVSSLVIKPRTVHLLTSERKTAITSVSQTTHSFIVTSQAQLKLILKRGKGGGQRHCYYSWLKRAARVVISIVAHHFLGPVLKREPVDLLVLFLQLSK